MKSLHPVYVGFGMLTPVAIMVVEQLPEHNTGALVKEVSEFVFDDAAIIACLLRQWEIPSAMIGTAVGDDPPRTHPGTAIENMGCTGRGSPLKGNQNPLGSGCLG